MKKLIALLSLSCFITQASVLPKLDALLELPAVDEQLELSKDAQVQNLTKPLRYAVDTDISNIYVKGKKSQGGQWDQLDADTWVWRLMVHSENAKTLDFGLFDFYLPPTAELRFYDWSGELAKGPFTDQKNKPHKQLWPGPLLGDIATVELKVSAKYKDYVSFSIKNITRGYRNIWPDLNLIPKPSNQKFWASNSNLKSFSCNIDVACDEGNAWRDQIRSVARYTINGNGLCSGSLVNNTAQDGKPMFLTADHCGFNSSNSASINLWWNYESNQCRTPGSSQSGTIIGIGSFNDTQSGSTYRAGFGGDPPPNDVTLSDFTLLELDSRPPDSYNVYYSGWDRRDIAPTSAVSIHHPSGHAKRISLENSPLSITQYVQNFSGDETHLRIPAWDFGTTEGGSSGSGLWNQDKLLVGVLSGGESGCNVTDWYGRINISWEGLGTSSTRLKDWLDPTNSGVQTLEALGECSSISASITHTSTDESVGVVQNFSISASGGTAPYTYSWDVNEDGFSDGTASTITSTYAQDFTGNVTVSIVDNEGCTGSATKAVVIRAPEIDLLSASTATQVCGNNDSFVDPGERWQVPVSFQNNGFETANNTYAVFEKKVSNDSLNIVSNDSFGNSIADCNTQFIDISSSGNILPIFPADSSQWDTLDEGAASVDLANSFQFYDRTVSSLSLSTNGYISTDSLAFGHDFSNDCPLPSVPSSDSNSARIIPFHGDLIVNNIIHQNFNSCPRTSELGGDLSCDVFMYQGVTFFGQQLNFDFQAILYPTVNQWVYQYRGSGFNGSNTTTGIQSDNASDGGTYACNTSNSISPQQAVCIFHKDNQPTLNTDSSYIHLETPALNLGNLAISQQQSDSVEFSIAEDAVCGSSVVLDYQAAVYDSGFNQENSNIANLQLGNNNQCNVVTNCNAGSSAPISPTNGLWYNSNRSGNGNDMYFNNNSLIYIQYTALEDRSPIWYITTDGAADGNQYSSVLTKFSHSGPYSSSSVATTEDIGTSLTTILDSNTAIQTRTINGEFSAEMLEAFIFSNSAVTQQRTGLWYNPAESGWGQTVGTQGDTEVIVNYLYDNNGQPYWVLGAGANSAIEDIGMTYFNAFCPHCPITPLESFSAGTVRINYDPSNTTATLESMSVTVDNQEHPNTWNRSNMPLNLLTPQIGN